VRGSRAAGKPSANQRREGKLVCRAREFRVQGFLRAPEGARVVRVAPLHDEVVLRTHDGEAIEVALVHQRLDIGDMQRSKRGIELDDHAAGGQLQIQRVLRIEAAPVGALGGC